MQAQLCKELQDQHVRAVLLQVQREALRLALTTRVIETVGDRFIKQLDVRAATESRDALAKTIYARLFDWIVAAINRKISSTSAHACLLPAAVLSVSSCHSSC